VEINRLAREMEQHGAAAADLSGCLYVTHIQKYNDTSFFTSDSDYVIREIRGILYRFDYQKEVRTDQRRLFLPMNLMLAALFLLTLSLLLWIRQKLLIPFTRLSAIKLYAKALSKGLYDDPQQQTKIY
jgi:hypothetical protein